VVTVNDLVSLKDAKLYDAMEALPVNSKNHLYNVHSDYSFEGPVTVSSQDLKFQSQYAIATVSIPRTFSKENLLTKEQRKG
jgi:hypothetical protein